MNLRCIEYWYRNTYYSFKPPGKVMTSATCNHTNMGDTIWSFHYTWHLATTKLNWKASNNNKIHSYLNDEVVDERGCGYLPSTEQWWGQCQDNWLHCSLSASVTRLQCTGSWNIVAQWEAAGWSLIVPNSRNILLQCYSSLEHNRYLPIPVQLVIYIDMCEKSW